MSDSLPETGLSGSLKVIRLLTGEELIGTAIENDNSIIIKFPARLESYITKDNMNNMIEYVKLTNYLSSIKNFEAKIFNTSIVYCGEPQEELVKMYNAYLLAIQSDPKSIMTSSASDSENSNDPGLLLLNDLFTNDDFVNFVNDLIETYEDSESLNDEEDVESVIEAIEEEMPKPQPKPKKRSRVKPETNKLPYNPEKPPENPESWSDNPSDYF
jgi:hypothetical protein